MQFSPIAPYDIRGNLPDHLLKKSEELALKSAALSGSLPNRIYYELRKMLRSVNSYYSNSIESEGTHPIDIERAINGDFDDSQERQRTIRKLSIAHMQVQMEIETLYSESDAPSPYALNTICAIHKSLYVQPGLEVLLMIKDKDDNVVKMIPGEIRERDVRIGAHIAPEAAIVASLMREYEAAYNRTLFLSMSAQIIHALSGHHRLTWIHPFLDGNGRISRLALDGAFYAMKLPGYGLWNISRGLARNKEHYKEMLSYADMIRQGATDGNGLLSSRALEYYVDAMLDMALDQVSYMSRYLKNEELSKRLEHFLALANSGRLETIEKIPHGAAPLFKHLLLQGECPRGEVQNITGLKERTARTLISELLKQHLIASDSPKGHIYINFRAELAQYLFPEIVPPYVPDRPHITLVAEHEFEQSGSPKLKA